MPHRLLVATYHYPPDPSVGGRRWEAMVGWLCSLGHEVTVLTTRAWGTADDGAVRVVRTSDLVASGMLRRLFARPPLPSAEEGVPVQKPPPRLLADVVVPDAYLVSWVLRAVPVARRLIDECEIDCLVTSGPPHSAHLLGLLLGRRRPAWIADFRDGWRYETLRSQWPTKVQDRLDATLERRVATAAEVTVGVTRPIARDFAERLGARSAHIPNGWDPRIELDLASVERPMLDRRFVNVVYTGQLAGPPGRDPKPLFRALDMLRRDHPDAAERLRVVLAGRLDTVVEKMLHELDPPDKVLYLGHLDRAATASLQRDADALLLLTTPGHASHATGKLFEYLAAGRPIIALADGSEAARIVTETGTGTTVSADQPEAIMQALLTAVDGRLASAFAPHRLDRYVYPAPAEEFAAEIDRAITAHNRR